MHKQRKDIQLYGTDTSNATATENDIAYGKTAYARGQLLTGTAIFGASNGGVEEIYGASKEPYTISETNMAIATPPDGADILSITIANKFSYDGNYYVRAIKANNTNYIESFAVNDDGLYYQASSNLAGDITYKKYRYTLEELGLTDNDGNIATEILDLALGCSGFSGDTSKCILAILYNVTINSTTTTYIKLLTYHLSDNGIIGKAYDNESYTVDYKMSVAKYYKKITGSPNNPLCFFLLYCNNTSYNSIACAKMKIIVSNNIYSATLYRANTITHKYYWNSSKLKASVDGKYVMLHTALTSGSISGYVFICSVEGDTPSVFSAIDLCASTYLEGLNKIITINNYSVGTEYYIKASIYTIIQSDGLITKTLDKSVKLNIENVTRYHYQYSSEAYATIDNSKLIVLIGSYPNSSSSGVKSLGIYVYDLKEILEAKNESEIEIAQQCIRSGSINKKADYFSINPNNNDTRIQVFQGYYDSTFPGFMYTLKNSIDADNLLGIIYKEKFFRNTDEHLLTAGQGDVRAGKTFIGWQGYPETGTMEVTE